MHSGMQQLTRCTWQIFLLYLSLSLAYNFNSFLGSVPVLLRRKKPKFDPMEFTQESIIRGCKYFWESDKDMDGRLNQIEFTNMVHTLGMDLDERSVHRAFRIADIDDNNLITFGEFITVYMNEIKPGSLTPNRIKGVFHTCDTSHKGHLTLGEFRAAMCKLGNVMGEKEAGNLLVKLVVKETINLEEFCSFLGLK